MRSNTPKLIKSLIIFYSSNFYLFSWRFRDNQHVYICIYIYCNFIYVCQKNSIYETLIYSAHQRYMVMYCAVWEAGCASSKCSYVALTARMHQPVQRFVAMQYDVYKIKVSQPKRNMNIDSLEKIIFTDESLDMYKTTLIPWRF